MIPFAGERRRAAPGGGARPSGQSSTASGMTRAPTGRRRPDPAGDADHDHVVHLAPVEHPVRGLGGQLDADAGRGGDHVVRRRPCRRGPPACRRRPFASPNAFTTGRSSDGIGANTPKRIRPPPRRPAEGGDAVAEAGLGQELVGVLAERGRRAAVALGRPLEADRVAGLADVAGDRVRRVDEQAERLRLRVLGQVGGAAEDPVGHALGLQPGRGLRHRQVGRRPTSSGRRPPGSAPCAAGGRSWSPGARRRPRPRTRRTCRRSPCPPSA